MEGACPAPGGRRLLLSIDPGRLGWGLATAVYFIATVLGHLAFSIWLVKGRTIVVGGTTHVYAFSYAVPYAAATAALVLCLWVAGQARRRPRAWPFLAYWLAWAAAVVMVDRHLTYSANEYAHFPQYGLLAWMLARVMDPRRDRWLVGRVLFWAALMGAVDESLQYLWITRSYSDYLDFNDILVNLLAGAAGVMVYYGGGRGGCASPPVRPWPVVELTVASCLAAGVLAAASTGRLRLQPQDAPSSEVTSPSPIAGGAVSLQRRPGMYGSDPPGRRHSHFHVLAPGPAAVVIAAVFACMLGFPAAAGVTPRPRPPGI